MPPSPDTGPTLVDALGLQPGETVALVGGGGKTTALYRLLDEAAAAADGRRALGTTTTRMWPPQAGQVDEALEAAGLDEACAALRRLRPAARRVLVTRGRSAEGKLLGVPPDWIAPLGAALDRPVAGGLERGRRLTVVEADGAAGRPVKAPAAHEPVLPAALSCLVPVAGADAIGAPLGPDIAHRPEEVARQGGLAPGEPLAPAALAAVLLSPRGNLRRLPPEGRVVPLVTRLAGGRHREAAERLAAHLLARGARRVVLGDLGGALAPAGPLTVVEARPSRVSGIVLAAGAGAEMVADVLAAALASGLAEIVVVLGRAGDAVGAAAASAVARRTRGGRPDRSARARLRSVVSRHRAGGQGTSVAAGVAAASAEASGYLLLPADHPRVRAPLIDRLLADHEAAPDLVLVPTCGGRRGDPVLVPADLAPALAGLPGDREGRLALAGVAERVRFVETDDPAVAAPRPASRP